MNKISIISGILGTLICVLAFFTQNYLEIPIAIFLVLLVNRHSFSYYAGIAIFAIYFVVSLVGKDVWGAIFCGFFIYMFISEWKNMFQIGNKIILNNLPHQMQYTYAILFLTFVVIDLMFGYISIGTEVFAPLYILTIMLSASTFLSLILICRKFIDAAYFYIAFLSLSMITLFYTLYQNFQTNGVISAFIVGSMLLIVLKVILVSLFIKENK